MTQNHNLPIIKILAVLQFTNIVLTRANHLPLKALKVNISNLNLKILAVLNFINIVVTSANLASKALKVSILSLNQAITKVTRPI